MEWQKMLKTKCVVGECAATRCVWNRNRQCSLKEIPIEEQGNCLEYNT